MTVTRLGAMSIGAAIPAIPVAIAQLTACLAPILADATKLTAAIANPITPPDIASYIAGLEAALANAIAALLALPGATLQLKAELGIEVGLLGGLALAAQVVLDALTGAANTGGFFGYSFDGDVSALGTEVGSAILVDIASGQAKAVVLATVSPSAWATLSTVMKTS